MPSPVRRKPHEDIILLAPVGIYQLTECPVDIGERLAVRPSPFALLYQIGQPDPTGGSAKNADEPLLLCGIVN